MRAKVANYVEVFEVDKRLNAVDRLQLIVVHDELNERRYRRDDVDVGDEVFREVERREPFELREPRRQFS